MNILKSKHERGLTLVETLVSIVIVSIILLSIVGLFIQTQKVSTRNNEKTVATYLAQSSIEHLQNGLFTKSQSSSNHFPPDLKRDLENEPRIEEYSIMTCKNADPSSDECERFYSQTINNRTYEIKIKRLQARTENKEDQLNLIPIELYVYYNQGSSSVSVEGYITK